MSGLEQRTKGRDEALAGATAVIAVTAPSAGAASAAAAQGPPVAAWSPIEADLLDERRAAVPAFPLELLPSPWRDWVGTAAQSADAPVDYVAQALLSAVAGVSSTGVRVHITRDWVEELVIWLAVVGAPSTGKSPALTSVRRLVHRLRRPRIDFNDDRPIRDFILYDGSYKEVCDIVDDRRHGHVLWRGEAEGRFMPLRGMSSARQFELLPVSILASIEPDGMTPALQQDGEGLAARFLYAWPHATPFCPLADRAQPESGEVQAALQRLVALGADTMQLYEMSLDAAAASAFDAFLAWLHAEVRQAEGLEAAWLGKGRGTVACLAATFALMSWSLTEQADKPRTIGVDSVERAVSLWSDYYRPHANAFFGSALPTDVDCQARRVLRWLQADGRPVVSRTEVTRLALGRTVDARGADRVIARLVKAGALRAVAPEGPQLGRPALRWQVNPLLAGA
jgi:hypothetical protein